jgi:hypothetical protein
MNSFEPWYLTSFSYAVAVADLVRLGKPLNDWAYVATEWAMS